jgi:ribonucleoside-diphosphate reductase subunit M1
MYYLRTMAASAPIQFTVDQAALQTVDQAVANKAVKRRTQRPVPAPMMEEKVTRNGSATPTSSEEDSDAHVGKLTVVKVNGSPKASPKKEVSKVKKEGMGEVQRTLSYEPEASKKTVGKIKREDMDEAERSIYDEKVIACSIEVRQPPPPSRLCCFGCS